MTDTLPPHAQNDKASPRIGRSPLSPYTPPLGTSGVYKITNTVNGHCYVGSSQDIQLRWQQHRTMLYNNRHHASYLQNAWNKYGAESFVFEIIELAEPTLCVQREQYWMDELHPTYNMSPTAQSALGVKWSEEARQRQSEATKGRPSAMKGRKHTPEAIAKMRESSKGQPSYWKGKHLPEEAVAKMKATKTGAKINKPKGYKVPYYPRPYQSERQRGVKHSPERIEKNRLSHIGKAIPPETRAKMSEAHKDYKPTDEVRAKISEAHKGKVFSPEHLAHLSEAHKGAIPSLEARARMSAAQKGRKHTEESRAKMSIAQKGKVVSEEARAKLRAAHQGTKDSPETRLKKSLAHKERWAKRRMEAQDGS